MSTDILQTIDRYVVLGNLGRGAKSSIWKVKEPSTGQIYTLKRVIRESEADDRFLEQAVTEYQVSSKLDHPFLRKSIELRRIRKWLKIQELLLVMEYVEGEQLKQMEPSGLGAQIDIFMKVADGLLSLHEQGFVHADIKPKNILVVPGDGIKIIDFGQTCPLGHRKKRIQGTPDYMAPEQKDRGILDQRTDIFNFGASLYWVLTGKKFPTAMSSAQSNGSGGELTGSVSFKDIPRPDALNSEIPSSLSKLVMDCCNTLQKDRPDNMREVMARLEVSKHLYEKQKTSQEVEETKPEPAAEVVEEENGEPPISDDDSDDFEKFIESIL